MQLSHKICNASLAVRQSCLQKQVLNHIPQYGIISSNKQQHDPRVSPYGGQIPESGIQIP
jgi:hypothetical protein